jgi:MraZ protein
MFLGEYEHSIDDKGRLTIPAKFRDELESGVVITRGLDGCLWAFPRAEWEQLVEKIRTLPSTNRATRGFVRFMFAGAHDSIPDRQGRVLIPQKLREHAGITGETAVIGVMNRVEIWNPTRWSEAFSRVEQDPDAIIAQLEELGINI